MKIEDMQRIAGLCRTPSYVFDLDQLAKHIGLVKSRLGSRARLCYAMKANPFLVGPMMELADSFEVCSPGEFQICERLSVPMERIVLSGVNKEEDEILRVMSCYKGEGTYTVESREHLRILDICSRKLEYKVKVLLRLTSGNQFGMDEAEILDILEKRADYPWLDIRGIQLYSGTQKKKAGKIRRELEQLDELYELAESRYNFKMPELEYGPGFFVSYFQKEEQADAAAVLDEFLQILDDMKFSGSITLEMGRFLAASCGYYFTEIVDQKCNKGQKYAIVDGGIHHLNYYGQTMAMKVPYYTHLTPSGEVREGETELWNICGSLCTVGDVLVKELPLRGGQIHDILVFENLGAYSVTEGIYLFLSRDLPGIYFYAKGSLRLVRDVLPTNMINSVNES